MKKLLSLFASFCIAIISVYSQSSHQLLKNADDQYVLENYPDAEELYRKAKEKDNSVKANYNLGNATFQQERYEEASEHFQAAINKASGIQEKSNAYYNFGNALFENQKLEEASAAFKESIKLNPNNEDARYNLAVTKQMIRMMQQQQQQQQQNQEDQDQQDKQKDQEQDKQNQNKDKQQQNDQDQQQKNEPENQEQKDSSQQNKQSQFDSTRLEKQELDSLDAAKLLEIIQNEEQKVQEKLRKFNSNRKRPVKDW